MSKPSELPDWLMEGARVRWKETALCGTVKNVWKREFDITWDDDGETLGPYTAGNIRNGEITSALSIRTSQG